MGRIYPIYYGKIKNVPNHQPVIIIIIHYRNIDLCSATMMIMIDTYVPNLRCPKSEVSMIIIHYHYFAEIGHYFAEIGLFYLFR